jgi:hypothetical protein
MRAGPARCRSFPSTRSTSPDRDRSRAASHARPVHPANKPHDCERADSSARSLAITAIVPRSISILIIPARGLGRSRFPWRHVLTRATGSVLVQRRVENQAIELDMVGLLLGLSLNRSNEQAEDKAQDCKSLHRSSPFLSCVHSADLFTPLCCRSGDECRLRYVAVLSGASTSSISLFAASEFPDE